MKKYYLCLIGFVIAVALVECKKDSILSSEPETQSETNPSDSLQEGSVVYSDFFRDNELIEQSVDSLVNLGSKENPAYFYVNLSHTIYDKHAQAEQTDYNKAFYAVTLDELEEFIPLYAKAQSLCGGIGMTNEEKVTAYQHLYNFILENNIDVAQLVSLTLKDGSVLNNTLECGKVIPIKNPDEYFPNTPNLPTIPEDIVPLLTNVQSTGVAVLDSILEHIVLRRDGLKIPFSLHDDNENNLETEADPYNKKTYVSYINESEDDSREYYDSQKFQSPIYTCRYGTKGNPMVESEFYIEGWYASKLKGESKKVLYVPYLKTIINNVYVGATMKLEGSVTYNQPNIRRLVTEEYPVIAGGEVVINYGDSWLVQRVGRLKFTVDGKVGFREENWDSNE